MESLATLPRQVPKRGFKRLDAAHYVGVSPSTFDNLVTQGLMPKPKRVGGNVIWDIKALDMYFEDLGEESVNEIDQALG